VTAPSSIFARGRPLRHLRRKLAQLARAG